MYKYDTPVKIVVVVWYLVNKKPSLLTYKLPVAFCAHHTGVSKVLTTFELVFMVFTSSTLQKSVYHRILLSTRSEKTIIAAATSNKIKIGKGFAEFATIFLPATSVCEKCILYRKNRKVSDH